ncbi:hypothetical protein L484_006040 [Morus notabilis]|uniref:RING-CH-type domain-containing protein n=1 Tax=Morus notabilis TaxID=981085 RepID=W9QEI9_9ROSA|nr:uncharacterized protein LOC21389487 [Morus notabilis]EXB30490.1 hypothetical protein L484_006040 [Morus notabilis]
MSAVLGTHHIGNDRGGAEEEEEEDSDEQYSWPQRESSESEECLSLSDVDLECGELEMKVHSDFKEIERDCRICHLGLECGVPIELGCSCKGDLGSSHKHCAETWFKIKGDTTCEICGVVALNIVGERTNVANAATVTAPSALAAPVILVETIWHGRRIMNFLLACMILAFITSWLFHFKIL